MNSEEFKQLTVERIAKAYRVPYWLIGGKKPKWRKRPVWRFRALIWKWLL